MSDELNADAVAAFLQANPDFFTQNRALLADLNLPHASGRAVSLVERQVDILRERNVVMRKRMNELLQTARINDQLFDKTRTLTLALLDCTSLQALNEVLATHMLADFEADFVCCHVIDTTGQPPELIHQGPLDHLQVHSTNPEFAHLLHSDTATCLSLRAEELMSIFPMAIEETTGSAVLVPFSAQNYDGILAIGSRKGDHFGNDMDTLFVSYIGDILNKAIQGLL